MKKRLASALKAALLLSVILMTAACSDDSAEDLYALPKGAEEYVYLEREINMLLSKGAEYSPPLSGSYRQSVQLEDLDGDGESEAIVFLSATAEERPLRMYIFKNDGEKVYQAALVDGDGTSFDSVNYMDLNGDGFSEIIVGRQVTSSAKMLTIYSTKNFEMSVLLSTDYMEYSLCSLSDHSGTDIFVIKDAEGTDQAKEANLFFFNDEGNIIETKAALSRGIESISRLRTTNLSDGSRAVVVEGRIRGGTIFTDVFTMDGGKIRNITVSPKSGVSDDTLRTYESYCTDINGDGIMEIPSPVQMPVQNGGGEYWLLKWYAYDSGGRRTLMKTTYSNTTDGWMLTVPDEWESKITVRRAEYVSGESSVIFSFIASDEQVQDFLTIYTLSGENKTERSKLAGRFVLASERDRIFAARITDSDAASALGVNQAMIKNNFSIIYSEWNTGEI